MKQLLFTQKTPRLYIIAHANTRYHWRWLCNTIRIAQFVIMLILGLMVSWWFKPNSTNMFPNIISIKINFGEIYCDAIWRERFGSTPGQVMACCWYSCGYNVDVHQPHCKNTDIERNEYFWTRQAEYQANFIELKMTANFMNGDR